MTWNLVGDRARDSLLLLLRECPVRLFPIIRSIFQQKENITEYSYYGFSKCPNIEIWKIQKESQKKSRFWKTKNLNAISGKEEAKFDKTWPDFGLLGFFCHVSWCLFLSLSSYLLLWNWRLVESFADLIWFLSFLIVQELQLSPIVTKNAAILSAIQLDIILAVFFTVTRFRSLPGALSNDFTNDLDLTALAALIDKFRTSPFRAFG